MVTRSQSGKLIAALHGCLLLWLGIAPAMRGAEPEPAGEPFRLREGSVSLRVHGIPGTAWEGLEQMLKDQLTLHGGGITAPLADDLAFFTRQHLLRAGWPEAEVRWNIENDRIHLRAETGRPARVGALTWTGGRVLPEDEMRRFLLRPALEKEGADKRHPLWVDSDLNSGAALLTRRLRSEGYLLAEAALTPASEPGADGLRALAIEVKPGPQFVFGGVALDGAPDELSGEMSREIAQTPGQPFNEAAVQALERRLNHIAVSRGWLSSVTSSEYHLGSQGGTVDVTLRMAPGARARVARALPHEGFSRGARRVLEAGFREAEGEWYSSKDTDFLFRRALDTGMFARLDVEPVIQPGNPEQPALADLVISGEETKPRTLGFEAGYDTFLGPQAGVNYRNTNLRDTGVTLATELNWSAAGPLGFVSLTDPAVFNSSHSGSVRLAVETFGLYEYTRYGSSLHAELARRLTPFFSYTAFFGASVNSISTDTLSSEETGPGTYTLATLGGSMMLDFRDSPVLPTKGWFLSARLETTLDVMGSSVGFLRTDLRGAWHLPVTKKSRLTLGGALMSIQGAAAEELPIDARVFNGGPNSVRAFAERELGPLTTGGTPLGGTSALLGTLEFSHEIYPNLEFAVFGDIGSLGRGSNTSALDISTDFRQAAGAGLRYKLPFGPVRVDYGHNTSRRSGEKSGMLHVTVGFSF
ncbi:MAG TPA: BamA/TamA family outer membrane protein [Prosthecobacter sp.]|nr:BamA/TamA family outer membrane protein [Prosthecobacter sp.]HRK14617.1 BamA/TamA family outer membrane protein [Prosthecobacter sp.]